MSALNKAALGVVVLALIAGNVYAYRQWTAERANSADLGKQLKEQTLALAAAQSARRTAELAAEAAAFEAHVAQARAAAAGAASAAPPVASVPAVKAKEPASRPDDTPMRASMAARMAELRVRLGTPEGREAYKRQQVSAMRRGMPDLGDALGLDEQGVDRFLDLLAETRLRQMEQMDPNAVGAGGAAAAANARAALTADLTAAFGNDVASRYQAYQDSSQGRSVVRNFLVGFAEADVSLNKTQRQQLVDSYTAAYKLQRSSQLAGGSPVAASPALQPQDRLGAMQRSLDTAQSTNNAVLAEAASYLSPSQLKILQRQQQSSLDAQRAGMDMMRQRSAAAGSGTASGYSGGGIVVRP